ncbi:hypothetical protein NLU13_2010 [Sarocladium strictum]|uniref:Uncharacterized protein n=1 Tax=Sarocladium strictum TaxID=5046 RepID=A0AA39GS10_SARSR|nr:hypothetical protein NLU13_2010 [Sarocladium strictum]
MSSSAEFWVVSVPDTVFINQPFYIDLAAADPDHGNAVSIDVVTDANQTTPANGPVFNGPRTASAQDELIDEGMDTNVNFKAGPFLFKPVAGGQPFTFFFQLLRNGMATGDMYNSTQAFRIPSAMNDPRFSFVE